MNPKRLKILIVDDDFSFRKLLARVFRKNWDCTVLQAEEGSEALRVMRKERPDLVFLDIMMPFMSGLDVLKTMRSHPKMADIPVVVCSSVDQEAEIAQILRCGANDYLLKPIDNKIIIKKISDLLKLESGTIGPAEKALIPPENTSSRGTEQTKSS